ncbi:MAG TPA: hypothetical protein VFB76_19310 [Candidatus Angelobacter sp.]|nr:hypothetical protein [Candidatus Angelobacter sp.]
MMPRLQLALAFLLPLSATALMAQEVAYLDLVDGKPRTELRAPSPPPPVCKEDGTCTFSGGIGGGSVGDGVEGPNEPRALKTTLLSLDRFAYAPDDAAEMEIKIENVGSVDMAIPWNPNLADFQPADEKQGFHYRSFVIVLKLTNAADKSQQLIMEAAHLYGIPGKPETLKVLKPGDWLRLRIKTKLATYTDKLKAGSDYSASVLPQLRLETFVPNLKYGSYSTDIANEYPRRLSGPELMLRISNGEEQSGVASK